MFTWEEEICYRMGLDLIPNSSVRPICLVLQGVFVCLSNLAIPWDIMRYCVCVRGECGILNGKRKEILDTQYLVGSF